MIVQGSLHLRDDGGRDAVLAEEQDGVERVTQPAKISALAFGQFHGGAL